MGFLSRGIASLTTEIRYPVVTTYAGLPTAEDNEGEVWLVRTTTGIIFVNRKRAGLYLSNGSSWDRLGAIQLAGNSIGYLPSNPPSGKCVVTNVYVDPVAGKLSIDYEETPI